jgi:hypothetical protein
MFNFFAKIKKSFELLSPACLTLACIVSLNPAWAQANTSKKQPSTGTAEEDFAYYATARLLSPDRKTELSSQEVKVNLSGSTSVALRGRGIKVVLESEPNSFRKAQMLRISANNDGTRVGGESAALNAGMFRLVPGDENSFLYTDKNRGWVLEVRLRPTQPGRSQRLMDEGKSKSPVRRFPRKPKRLPA